VFLINHDIDPGGVASAQIVTDDAQGARLGAQSFVEAMGEEGTYVELTGAEADPDAAVRSTSYRGVISRYPDLELVAQERANGDQQQAFARMRAIVTRNPGIDGVIAGNDAMALGAVAALQAANLSDVIVVGFDGSPDAIGAVKEGTMHATVFQPVAQMAELAVEQAHELITTGEATQPERQTIDGELVTRANVDDYGVPGPA
jgi:erythritol transport system substrate-binding protein